MEKITVTLTGDTALDYLNNDLPIKHNKLQEDYYKLQEKYKKLEKDYNSYINNVEDTASSTNTNIIDKVIKPNPIQFPATLEPKKNGTRWKSWELVHIETTNINDDFSNLCTKLHNRSEAAIRSKLNEYNLGVRNNKIIKLR